MAILAKAASAFSWEATSQRKVATGKHGSRSALLDEFTGVRTGGESSEAHWDKRLPVHVLALSPRESIETTIRKTCGNRRPPSSGP